ncbi:hypothetical protein FPQ18DRAFT_345176 [Pyronema domesticum]|nr:hypothetical protein FPQ18DRAFT_345176 [Pyronema domesticum]
MPHATLLATSLRHIGVLSLVALFFVPFCVLLYSCSCSCIGGYLVAFLVVNFAGICWLFYYCCLHTRISCIIFN